MEHGSWPRCFATPFSTSIMFEYSMTAALNELIEQRETLERFRMQDRPAWFKR